MPKVRTANEIGKLIRSRRVELQLDQAELAERVGVSRQWVIAMEQGAPRARLELVLRTLSALNLEVWVSDQGDRGGSRLLAKIVAEHSNEEATQ